MVAGEEEAQAMIDPKQTRGYLNRNPGNMDRDKIGPPWDGEIRDPAKCVNDVQRGELAHGRFCVFIDAEHGIRAMVKNLRAYRDRLGCRTVRDFIMRWAPPNENNTHNYIVSVAHSAAVDPDFPVDIEIRRIMRAIVTGIICVECGGNPYTTEIEAGMDLADVSS